ncbi:MAG: flippase-like domain-containing protein [Chloroflexi bacterium]|nr:flippase-like domain-containing protein [Chloroflexota bacterium]
MLIQRLKDKQFLQTVWRYLNILLALVLLWFVLHEVGIDELIALFQSADPTLIVLSALIGPPGLIINAYKWQILLKALNYRVSLSYLFQVSLTGYFFNTFLPSSVGGDVVRVAELGARIKDPASAAASVFVDRLLGFLVMISLAGFALVLRFLSPDSLPLSLVILAVLLGIVMLAWFALDARPLVWAQRHVRLGLAQKVFDKLAKFQTALRRYQSQRRVLVIAVALSVFTYVRGMIIVYLAVAAFAPTAPFFDVALTVPISMTAAALPFAINGIGVQEWSLVLLFPMIGLTGSLGLSTMLVVRLATLFTVFIGGLVYLRSRIQRQPLAVNGPVLPTSDLQL